MAEPAFPVVPGERVGPFQLGMTLHTALATLGRLSPQLEDVRPSALHFSRNSPLTKPLVLRVNGLGLDLNFEPEHQRLVVIDVYDVGASLLDFQGLVIGGKSKPSRERGVLKTMYDVLGVTHSGFRKKELGDDTFCLQYPGLLVAFNVPAKENTSGIPLALSDGRSPPLTRVTVHEFDFGKTGASLPRPPSQASVHINVSDENGVELFFLKTNYVLVLGTSTCQDVLASLGANHQMTYKQNEPIGTKARRKERQQDSSASEQEDLHTRDYFFNYFDQGLDVLLDGRTHTLKKVILRTNLVPHPNFGLYEKCSFTVRFSDSNLSANRNGKTRKPRTPPSFEDLLVSPSPPLVSPKLVSCDENWATIQRKLDIDEKPMVNEKIDQPFGPCLLFGYRRSVFEVDKASMHIASLTLF